MAKKVIDLTIRLKDGVTGTLNKIGASVRNLGSGFKSLVRVGVKAFAALAAAAGSLGYTIKKAFDFETAKVQLKSLLGSMGAATKRFAELKKFSAETPFQLPDILKASRLLTVFSEGALGSAESLRSIGDSAAVAGQGISDVAFWVGRAYSMIKGGKPFGEAAMRLQEMGILTSKGRSEIEALTASGADFETVWARLQKELGRFDGGMRDLSQTGNGLISTLKDNWTIAVATFGEEFTKLAKEGLTDAINTIKRLTTDGTITAWAQQAKAGLEAVVQTIKIITSGDKAARGRVVGALSNVITASFMDGAVKAGNLLLKYAPIIGGVIGSALMGAIKGDERDKVTKGQLESIQKQSVQEVGTGLSIGDIRKRSSRRDELIKIQERKNREARFEKEGIETKKGFGMLGENSKKAMASLLEVLEKEGEKLNEGASSAFKDVTKEAVSGSSTFGGASSPAASAAATPKKANAGFIALAKRIENINEDRGLLRKISAEEAVKSVAKWEREGQRAGIEGLGAEAEAAMVAGTGPGVGLDMQMRELMKLQQTGEQTMGGGKEKNPVKETNELLEVQNKMLEERLGGVE